MRLPPLLVVAVRLVLGIVGTTVVVGTVVVADVASTLGVGNVVVEVLARACACIAASTSLASPRSNLACTAFEFARAEWTMIWQPLSRHALQIGSTTE